MARYWSHETKSLAEKLLKKKYSSKIDQGIFFRENKVKIL